MSRKNNVNPDHYKVAGRERQGENIVQSVQRQAFAQQQAQVERWQARQHDDRHPSEATEKVVIEPPDPAPAPKPAPRAARPKAKARPAAEVTGKRATNKAPAPSSRKRSSLAATTRTARDLVRAKEALELRRRSSPTRSR